MSQMDYLWISQFMISDVQKHLWHFEHLNHMMNSFDDYPIIYLADRYYGSAEIISYLESHTIKYCIRGRKSTYKSQVGKYEYK